MAFIGGANGGAASNSCGCEVCDAYFNQVELDTVEVKGSRSGFFDNSSLGWGTFIGSTLGSRFGIAGSLLGGVAGHYVETIDYNQMAEDYKNQIDADIKNGNIPAD